MRDFNKIAEKMTDLWATGKSNKVKPVKKPETTDEMITKAMKEYGKGKK